MLWNENECRKKIGNKNLKGIFPSTDYDRLETTRECGIFNYLGSIITNDERCTCQIKCRIVITQSVFNSKDTLRQQIELNFKEETREVLPLKPSIFSYFESTTLEVLLRVEEERNTLHTIQRSKANWIGYVLRRLCLLKHIIEGKIEGQL
jgi:hypothetical protein